MQVQKTKQSYKKVISNFRKIENIPVDWKLSTISDIGKIIGGGTPKTTKEEYWNGKIPWAVPGDMTKLEVNTIEKTERNITEMGLKNSSAILLKPGTILLTSRATIGYAAINQVPMATNQGFQNIECNKGNYNQFWFYAIQYNKIKFLRFTYGTTFLEISKKNVKKVNICHPDLQEQQKIAFILSPVDSAIQQTNKIIEQAKFLKQGLMQKLLTKGIGHTKFKKQELGRKFIFENMPIDWKFSKLGELTSVHGRIGWKNLRADEYTESGPLMLSVWSLDEDRLYGVDYNKGIYRLSKFRYDESPEIKLQNEDVLVAKDGDIGRIGYVKKLNEPTTVNSHVVVVRISEKSMNSEFLYWYFKANSFQRYCVAFTSGTTVPLLSQKNLKDVIIPIPSKEEQEKIASILTNVDSQVKHYQIIKTNLEEKKKGLMQKLLTGKIRV